MGFFKKWKEKRENKKQQTKEIKHPESSYDLYNQSETLTLQTGMNKNKDILVDYNENMDISNTNLNKIPNNQKSTNKKSSSKTKTIEVAKSKNKSSNTNTTTLPKNKGGMMAQDKKGRNIYYVSARKDKDGKRVGWEVKKENAEKITKLCKTKDEAIEYVKEKAGNQGSTCVIRKLDGSIDKTLKFDTEQK